MTKNSLKYMNWMRALLGRRLSLEVDFIVQELLERKWYFWLSESSLLQFKLDFLSESMFHKEWLNIHVEFLKSQLLRSKPRSLSQKSQYKEHLRKLNSISLRFGLLIRQLQFFLSR